jgi:hypothetical protein
MPSATRISAAIAIAHFDFYGLLAAASAVLSNAVTYRAPQTLFGAMVYEDKVAAPLFERAPRKGGNNE